MRSLIDAQIRRFTDLALGCQDKEVEQLTDDEKMALYFMAGVEMRTTCPVSDGDVYRFTMTTVRPVGMVKVDGKFRVAELVRSEGERLSRLGMLHFED